MATFKYTPADAVRDVRYLTERFGVTAVELSPLTRFVALNFAGDTLPHEVLEAVAGATRRARINGALVYSRDGFSLPSAALTDGNAV